MRAVATFLIVAAYSSSGISQMLQADEFDMRCHGQHLPGRLAEKVFVAAMAGPVITLAAAAFGLMQDHDVQCETGYGE